MKKLQSEPEKRFSNVLNKFNILKGKFSNIKLESDSRLTFDFIQFLKRKKVELLPFGVEQNLIDEILIIENFKTKLNQGNVPFIDSLGCQKDKYFKETTVKYSTIVVDLSKKKESICSFVLTSKNLFLFKNSMKQINEEWNFDHHWISNSPILVLDLQTIQSIFTSHQHGNLLAILYKSEIFIFKSLNLNEILQQFPSSIQKVNKNQR
jgi:hypothetical protein